MAYFYFTTTDKYLPGLKAMSKVASELLSSRHHGVERDERERTPEKRAIFLLHAKKSRDMLLISTCRGVPKPERRTLIG